MTGSLSCKQPIGSPCFAFSSICSKETIILASSRYFSVSPHRGGVFLFYYKKSAFSCEMHRLNDCYSAAGMTVIPKRHFLFAGERGMIMPVRTPFSYSGVFTKGIETSPHTSPFLVFRRAVLFCQIKRNLPMSFHCFCGTPLPCRAFPPGRGFLFIAENDMPLYRTSIKRICSAVKNMLK